MTKGENFENQIIRQEKTSMGTLEFNKYMNFMMQKPLKSFEK